MFDLKLQNYLDNEACKLVSADFHPTRPWVVFALENGLVKIWNFETNELVFTFSPSNLEQSEKDAHAMYLLLEKDPLYMGPKRLETKDKPMNEKKKYGPVKCLKFIDQDVRYMKYQQEVCHLFTYIIQLLTG